MRIDVDWTIDDVVSMRKQLALEQYHKSGGLRTWLKIYAVYTVITLSIAGSWIYFGKDLSQDRVNVIWTSVAFGIAVTLVWMHVHSARQMSSSVIRSQVIEELRNGQINLGRETISIESDAVRFTGTGVESTIQWPLVKSVKCVEALVMIEFQNANVHRIPCRAFAQEADVDVFVRLVQSRIDAAKEATIV